MCPKDRPASWLALVCALAVALLGAPAMADPARCRVGAYVTGLSPIDFGAHTVHIDAYVWVRCPISVAPENTTISIVGADDENRSEAYTEDSGDERYRIERVRATLRVPLSLRNYPFDTQRIRFDVEPANATASEVRYVLDNDPALQARPCCLDQAMSVPNWRIVSSAPSADLHRYGTRLGYTFGQSNAQQYPRFRVEITLRRHVKPYLWKVLLPLAIILAMALASSFWPPSKLEASTNVLVGSLLAVVLAHLTQRGELPDTGYLVTGDLFFFHAYLMLLLMLVITTRAHHAEAAGEHEEALWLQRVERRMVPVVALGGWGLIASMS